MVRHAHGDSVVRGQNGGQAGLPPADERQRPRPEAIHQRPASGRNAGGYHFQIVGVGQQNRDALLRRAPLQRKEPSHSLRLRQNTNAIDGVGGEDDGQAKQQQLGRRLNGRGVAGPQMSCVQMVLNSPNHVSGLPLSTPACHSHDPVVPGEIRPHHHRRAGKGRVGQFGHGLTLPPAHLQQQQTARPQARRRLG